MNTMYCRSCKFSNFSSFVCIIINRVLLAPPQLISMCYRFVIVPIPFSLWEGVYVIVSQVWVI